MSLFGAYWRVGVSLASLFTTQLCFDLYVYVGMYSLHVYMYMYINYIFIYTHIHMGVYTPRYRHIQSFVPWYFFDAALAGRSWVCAEQPD